MTPVLLDQRTLFKSGVTVSIGMLAVFFCGYFIGQQRPVTGNGMELNQTIALALPRPAHADTAEYGPRLPRDQAPGADIDVDSPDDTAAAGGAAETAVSSYNEYGVDAAIKQTTDSIETPAAEHSAEQGTEPMQLASLASAPIVFDAGVEVGGAVETDQNLSTGTTEQPAVDGTSPNNTSAIVDTAGAEDARYTIQVGVFADADNAARRISELESLQLSAYLNEYTNKREEARFNVRFGYFNNKSSALAALGIFENDLSGSGFVTRIRHTVNR